MGDATVTVTARGNLALAEVLNPSLLSRGALQGFGGHSVNFSTYGADSSVNLTAIGGNVLLDDVNSDFQGQVSSSFLGGNVTNGQGSLAPLDLFPSTLNMYALSGNVDILRGLVGKADVFSQGYRPGTLANRGLSPEELAAIRPGLVYVSLCAFSQAGPWASRRGFDTVVQTVSGMTIRQAECIPGKSPAPQFYPVSAIDYCTGYLMAFGAMVALARRAREGGSWLVRISLAQVGKWIVDLGEVPAAALMDVPAEFTASELERWSTESETPSGRLGHLKPAVQLSETPPYWARPSVPLGYHCAVWP